MANKPSNNVHKLFNYIMENMLIKNDRGLAEFLDVPPPTVSRIRSGQTTFGPKYILRLHEQTGWPVATIKGML